MVEGVAGQEQAECAATGMTVADTTVVRHYDTPYHDCQSVPLAAPLAVPQQRFVLIPIPRSPSTGSPRSAHTGQSSSASRVSPVSHTVIQSVSQPARPVSSRTLVSLSVSQSVQTVSLFVSQYRST